MDATNLASIAVAVIAALAAIASQRSASRASTAGSRLDAEREAYERARKFDTDTIARQAQELKELREEKEELEEQVDILRWRVYRLEQGLPPAPYPEKEKNDVKSEPAPGS